MSGSMGAVEQALANMQAGCSCAAPVAPGDPEFPKAAALPSQPVMPGKVSKSKDRHNTEVQSG